MNGGPAFPAIMDNPARCRNYPGMSLRDYFAGQALTELAHPDVTGVDLDLAAKRAYKIADAMIMEKGDG